MRIPKSCLSIRSSVRLFVPREKKPPVFVNISPTVIIIYLIHEFTSATAWKPKILSFLFKIVRNLILNCILSCPEVLHITLAFFLAYTVHIDGSAFSCYL